MIRVNKIFFDRRANVKPRWLCQVQGGTTPNSLTFDGKGVGCCRAIALRRAVREMRKKARKS